MKDQSFFFRSLIFSYFSFHTHFYVCILKQHLFFSGTGTILNDLFIESLIKCLMQTLQEKNDKLFTFHTFEKEQKKISQSIKYKSQAIFKQENIYDKKHLNLDGSICICLFYYLFTFHFLHRFSTNISVSHIIIHKNELYFVCIYFEFSMLNSVATLNFVRDLM